MMARVSDIVNSTAYRGNMFRSSCVHRLSLTQDRVSSLRDIRRRPNPQPLRAHRYLVLNDSIFFVVRVPSTEQCGSSLCKGMVVGWIAWIQFLITTKDFIPAAARRTMLQGNQFSTVVGNIERWEGDRQEREGQNLRLAVFQNLHSFSPYASMCCRSGARTSYMT